MNNNQNSKVCCGGVNIANVLVPTIALFIPTFLYFNKPNINISSFALTILSIILIPYIIYHLLRMINFRFIIINSNVFYKNLFGKVINGTINEIDKVIYNKGRGITKQTPKIVVIFKNKKIVMRNSDHNFYRMRDFLMSKGIIKSENIINPHKWIDDLAYGMASPLVKLINWIKRK